MKNGLKGFPKVFSFTFSRQVGKKGYKYATITVALLCLLVPAMIMSLVELTAGRKQEMPGVSFCGAEVINVVDKSPAAVEDLSFLNDLGIEGYNRFEYAGFGENEEEAIRKAGDRTLILIIDKPNDAYSINVVIPAVSMLGTGDAEAFRDFIHSNFRYVLYRKAGIEDATAAHLAIPSSIEVATGTGSSEPESVLDIVREVLSIVLPYANIMVLYFMILMYGQGVANNVIMEKTSKLMDTFLIAINPSSMVMGKMLAMALSGLLQLVAWIVCLIGGFAAGAHIVKLINPATEMGLIRFFDSLSIFSGVFSLPAILLAILILVAGFILYCSLAAIGGSLASKPEDLSSTNMLFTFALILSLFCSIYAGGMGNMLSSSEQWLNWFPLTAILVTPSRVILGDIPTAAALGSLALILACSFVLVLLAGKIYSVMSLYKGNPPGIGKLAGMLRAKKG